MKVYTTNLPCNCGPCSFMNLTGIGRNRKMEISLSKDGKLKPFKASSYSAFLVWAIKHNVDLTVYATSRKLNEKMFDLMIRYEKIPEQLQDRYKKEACERFDMLNKKHSKMIRKLGNPISKLNDLIDKGNRVAVLNSSFYMKDEDAVPHWIVAYKREGDKYYFMCSKKGLITLSKKDLIKGFEINRYQGFLPALVSYKNPVMKILAIGDFHGKFPAKLKKLAKEVDLVISTGDFGGSDKLLKIIFKYWRQGWWKIVGKEKARKYVMEDYNSGLKMINELDKLGTPVYTIAGNWDFDKTSDRAERTAKLRLKRIEKIIKKKKNIDFIHRKLRNFKGLRVYGFGGRIIPYIYLSKEGTEGDKQRRKYKRQHRRLEKQLMKRAVKDLDIFVGHYTPYGYFDKVKYHGENPMNGKHVGFKVYTDYIKKYKPKLFVCGHMHEYQGKKKLGDTLIVTTGAAKEGKAALIEWDEKRGKVKKVGFVK